MAVKGLSLAPLLSSVLFSCVLTAWSESPDRADLDLEKYVVLPTGNTRLSVLGGASGRESDEEYHQSLSVDRQALHLTCQHDVQQFIQENQELVRLKGAGGALQPNPEDMLFFLHVPRTAGRTFFSCFLKQAIPPSKRCAKSYDVLRLNVSVADCGLLSSHDDYSATKFFPESAAILTQVRDPVERALSAYEFSIEVASRELRRPANAPRPSADKINTRNVWPWSLLVPWMEADMQARIKKVKATAVNDPEKQWVQLYNSTTEQVYFHNFFTKRSLWSVAPEDGHVVPALDPYNNPLTMPLREFVEHPLVRNTIHNGASLQILGLTNYSHLETSTKLRSCISGLPAVREAMTKAALARLSTMFHVGVTDRLEESIASAASVLGLSLGGPSWKGKADAAFSYDDDQEPSHNKTEQDEIGGEVQRIEWEARIAMISEAVASKEKELRRANAGIRTAQYKQAQTYGGNQQQNSAEEELARFTEESQRLQREIDELRQEIADLQVLVVKLKTPLPKMHSAAARMVKNDDEFKNDWNLTTAYHRCVANSRAKNTQRWKPLTALKTIDGRTFHYSSEARKNIAPDIIARIRQLNSMDVKLYETANKLLAASLDQQVASGTRQMLSPPSKNLQAGSGPPLPDLPSEGLHAGDSEPGGHSTPDEPPSASSSTASQLEGGKPETVTHLSRGAGARPHHNRAPEGPSKVGRKHRRRVQHEEL